MNPLRHDFINRCLASSSTSTSPTRLQTGEGTTYLDIGSGGGIFAESAARLPGTASVLGIDPTPEVFAVAQAHAQQDPLVASKLNYENTSIEHLTPQQFDIVTIFEVIEHVDQPSQFLSTVEKFVKPGGWLIMSTISRTWLSWLITIKAAEDVIGVVPQGTHDWGKYIKEEELRAWFYEGGGRTGKWDVSGMRSEGVVYVPGFGWKFIPGSEKVGNYFLGVQRMA
jgi:polyprenyldihydroxybenzoate methyltransferase / 3-demethylubiquinol 3-O-methyltransferase